MQVQFLPGALKLAMVDRCRKTKSIGYFIGEDDDCIRIAYSVAEDDEVSYEVIPKGMVRNIRKIEDCELNDFGN